MICTGMSMQMRHFSFYPGRYPVSRHLWTVTLYPLSNHPREYIVYGIMCNILYPISLVAEEFSVYPVSRAEKTTGGRSKRDKLLTKVAQGTPNLWGPSEFRIIVALHLRDACLYESLWPLILASLLAGVWNV
jgi:hypothetical protein